MKYEQMSKAPDVEIQQGDAPAVGQEVEVASNEKGQRSSQSIRQGSTSSEKVKSNKRHEGTSSDV